MLSNIRLKSIFHFPWLNLNLVSLGQAPRHFRNEMIFLGLSPLDWWPGRVETVAITFLAIYGSFRSSIVDWATNETLVDCEEMVSVMINNIGTLKKSPISPKHSLSSKSIPCLSKTCPISPKWQLFRCGSTSRTYHVSESVRQHF